MPTIQWTNLPPALRDHLFERLRERQITADDLYRLKTWRESAPEAPEDLPPEGTAREGHRALTQSCADRQRLKMKKPPTPEGIGGFRPARCENKSRRRLPSA